MEIKERTSEQACNEVNAIVALMNIKVTQLKFTQQGVGKTAQMVPTSSFEHSPFTEKELTYLKSLAFVLVSECLDAGELAKYVRTEAKAEENKEVATTEEAIDNKEIEAKTE